MLLFIEYTRVNKMSRKYLVFWGTAGCFVKNTVFDVGNLRFCRKLLHEQKVACESLDSLWTRVYNQDKVSE